MRETDSLKDATTFSLSHLKQALFDIKEHGPNVCVRFRFIGQMWQPNFVRIVNLTDTRVLVSDEVKNQLISFELNHVMQFEIDHRFKGLEPHNHYNVGTH